MVGRTNWLNTPNEDHFASHILEDALSGYKAGGEPRRMRQAEEQELLKKHLMELQNQHAQDVNQYYPQQQEQGLEKGGLDIQKLQQEIEFAPLDREQKMAEWKQKQELAESLMNYRKSQIRKNDRKSEGGSGNSLLDQVRQMNINAGNFDKAPANIKQQSLALLNGVGIPGDEGVRRLRGGESVDDILRSKGLTDAQIKKVKPAYVTDAINIRQQRMRDAVIAELNIMEPEITDWMAPYIGTWANYSPKQIINSAWNKDPEGVAKYLAAISIQPEMAALRIKAMGGNVGEGAIHNLVEKALGNNKILQGQVSPEVYRMMQHYVTDLLNKGASASRNEIYNSGGKATETESEWEDVPDGQ